MAKEETVSTDSRIVTHGDRVGGVDEAHLHDLAIPPHDKLRIRELQPTDKNLFVDFRSFADFDMWSIDKRGGADLNVAPDLDFASADDRQESDLRTIANFDIVRQNDGPKSQGNVATNPVSLQAIDKYLDR